ncbi:hypothetical protein ASPFODRAFT_32824 [Aspergillus luchuensis CBS 106.47]|uniref:Jacalin-type lectin domain-containing protein n=1 Tax=Aspergillus luchuensis (strain CBS 106.47) TaxID=1137211 RepID=A0A1M3TIT9_ASPLC|nr:hypothetical protein ASPFODRAFT_32824 [Aspergillus luchuensis CBS 106.47]
MYYLKSLLLAALATSTLVCGAALPSEDVTQAASANQTAEIEPLDIAPWITICGPVGGGGGSEFNFFSNDKDRYIKLIEFVSGDWAAQGVLRGIRIHWTKAPYTQEIGNTAGLFPIPEKFDIGSDKLDDFAIRYHWNTDVHGIWAKKEDGTTFETVYSKTGGWDWKTCTHEAKGHRIYGITGRAAGIIDSLGVGFGPTF